MSDTEVKKDDALEPTEQKTNNVEQPPQQDIEDEGGHHKRMHKHKHRKHKTQSFCAFCAFLPSYGFLLPCHRRFTDCCHVHLLPIVLDLAVIKFNDSIRDEVIVIVVTDDENSLPSGLQLRE